jgi:hypothetical protein
VIASSAELNDIYPEILKKLNLIGQSKLIRRLLHMPSMPELQGIR